MTTPADPRRLRDIILDQCEAKSLSLAEMIQKTGTPAGYVDAILNDVRSRLPGFPYIRIFLVRIAETLGLSAEVLIQAYKREFGEKISGLGDRLPSNRFALPSGRRRYLLILGALAGVVVTYGVLRSGLASKPALLIVVPPASADAFLTHSSTIQLAGRIGLSDTLLINGQAVPTDPQGNFTSDYQLLPEINLIEFSSHRFLGGTTSQLRQVYLDVAPVSRVAASVRASSTEPSP